MNLSRVIPVLLVHKGGLVKTEKFRKPKYVGDPINAIKIFNDKEVDELVLVDIDATRESRAPNYDLIEQVANECFMPLCYGGGVTTIDQMRRIFAIGVEKISLSASALQNPELVSQAVEVFGGQSVIVTLDLSRNFLGKLRLTSHNGKKTYADDPLKFAMKMVELGVGEIVLNDVENDGVMKGYNIDLVARFTSSLSVPVVALGGAGSIEDLRDVIQKGGAAAAAAGSLFVFTGVHKAVLITYPTGIKI